VVTKNPLADTIIYLILSAFTVTFFLLQVTQSNLLATNLWGAISLIVFGIIAVFSLVILAIENGLSKIATKYFENLNFEKVIYIIVFAVLMYVVNLISAALLPATVQPLTIPGQTSLTTSILSDILFTFTVVALAEESLKIAGYTTFRAYFTTKIGRAGGLLISIVPVALWAGFHAIQAYNNLWYLLPAFADGLMLLALLELTKSFLAPVIAHGIYNSTVILSSYVSGKSPLPLFPASLTASDFFLLVLTFVWVLLGVVIPVWLGGRESTKQKRLF
jgi:membrane protease YdiL (CAAX protease family)